MDREALGGLAVAIRDWAGAVVSAAFLLLYHNLSYYRLSFLITMSLYPPCVSSFRAVGIIETR